MWFKRKPKNRRLGREQALDVKLRSSQVRAARTRMGAISLGAVFATVFGAYLLYRAGGWVLRRGVYENKAFRSEPARSAPRVRAWARSAWVPSLQPSLARICFIAPADGSFGGVSMRTKRSPSRTLTCKPTALSRS